MVFRVNYYIWIRCIIGLGSLAIIMAQSLRIGLILAEFRMNDVDNDNIPGRGGVDYPIYNKPPEGTSFRCKNHDYSGYFADVEAGCQAYHVCFPDGRNASFLCVNGTVFHQRYYICDWWFHSNCSQAPDLYELNLYRKVPLPVLPPVRGRPLIRPMPEPKVVYNSLETPNPKKELNRERKPSKRPDKRKNTSNKPPDTSRKPRQNSEVAYKTPGECVCTCDNDKKPSDKYLSMDLMS